MTVKSTPDGWFRQVQNLAVLVLSFKIVSAGLAFVNVSGDNLQLILCSLDNNKKKSLKKKRKKKKTRRRKFYN